MLFSFRAADVIVASPVSCETYINYFFVVYQQIIAYVSFTKFW